MQNVWGQFVDYNDVIKVMKTCFVSFRVNTVMGFNLYDIGETYLDSRYIRLGLHVSKEMLISNMYIVYRE